MPEEFAAISQSEIDRYRDIVKCPPSAALRQIEWSRERRISGSS